MIRCCAAAGGRGPVLRSGYVNSRRRSAPAEVGAVRAAGSQQPDRSRVTGAPSRRAVISANPSAERSRPGSVRRPPIPGVPGSPIRDDDDARRTGRDRTARSASARDGVMTGYWHSPRQETAATCCAAAGCTPATSGRLDADGYLYVRGPKKDLILRGGFNVFPRDIGGRPASQHPAVAMAGVGRGRPDPAAGQKRSWRFVSLLPRQPGHRGGARRATPRGRLAARTSTRAR